MNKAEVIAAIAEKNGSSRKDAEQALESVLSVIEDALVKGDKVQFIGFGSFEVKERAARTGHNPQTNEPMEIAASKMPVFKPGKSLKDKVNA